MPTRSIHKIYQPGDTARSSGLYTVFHLDHREPHLVLVLAGELFPACRTCKGQVRFQMEREAPHFANDFDLTAPATDILFGGRQAV